MYDQKSNEKKSCMNDSVDKKNTGDEKEQDTLFTKLLFLNLSSAGIFGDERLLPAILQELSVAFHASLSQLGALTFAGAISQALSFPLGKFLQIAQKS